MTPVISLCNFQRIFKKSGKYYKRISPVRKGVHGRSPVRKGIHGRSQNIFMMSKVLFILKKKQVIIFYYKCMHKIQAGAFTSFAPTSGCPWKGRNSQPHFRDQACYRTRHRFTVLSKVKINQSISLIQQVTATPRRHHKVSAKGAFPKNESLASIATGCLAWDPGSLHRRRSSGPVNQAMG